MTERTIIHVDMDAFYASVEVLDNPKLGGLPVVVGGSLARGVVSSASYEARRFGVHSAMPIAQALRLCPRAVVLPVRMDRYAEESRKIHEIFLRFTPQVEPLSIDEAFLDVTRSRRLFGSGQEIAKKIRAQIREETGLPSSAGVGPGKLVAKIASDLAKPDGLLVVGPHEVQEFLDRLPVCKLFGVGPAAGKKLSLLGVRTVGDVRNLPLAVLEKNLGSFGQAIHDYARGLDDREVSPGREIKSVGREETFSKDILEAEKARAEILDLSRRVARRLRKKGFSGRTVTLKVKYHDFTQITRSRTLTHPVEDPREIFDAAAGLMEKTQIGQRPVRLLGISVSQPAGKGEASQLDLFGNPEKCEKQKRLIRALDRVWDSFGESSVVPGTLVPSEPEKKDPEA